MEIDLPFGMDCQTYKWRQNLSHVEIFIQIPSNVENRQVKIITSSTKHKVTSDQIHVKLKPRYLRVAWSEDPFMEGELSREIKAEDSTWFLSKQLSVTADL